MTSYIDKLRLRIDFENGFDENKKMLLSRRSYSMIKEDAADENLVAFANAINTLSKKQAVRFVRVEEKVIKELSLE